MSEKLAATVLEHTPEGWGRSDIDLLEIADIPKYCYVFVNLNAYPKEGDDRIALLRFFNVPDILASKMCTVLNGYFGSRGDYDGDKLTSYSTWFRCLVKMIDEPNPDDKNKDYVWYEMGFFTRWRDGGYCQVLCVDTPPDLKCRLQKAVQEKLDFGDLDFRDPFAMHAPLLDELVYYNDKSVWAIRDPIRRIEKNRPSAAPDFTKMHEITRHTIHVAEVLAVTIQTFEKFRVQQEHIYASLADVLGKGYREQAKEYLSFQLQMVRSLRERSISNHERLKSEIIVAYNRLAQQDNRVMKSIALLTMTFLPATFISALFSTTFFSYGDEKLHASAQIWIYWVVTIPSTLLIVVIWRSLLNRNPPVTWRTIWRWLVPAQKTDQGGMGTV